MATVLETPSRIWRRIEAIEHREMPSLPSLPHFEESEAEGDESQAQPAEDDELIRNFSPMHSTPTTQHTITSSQRGSTTTITNSTARFAHSIASRSNKSSSGIIKKSRNDSFDVPSLPVIQPTSDQDSDEEGAETRSSVPDIYLPPEADDGQQDSAPDFSMADALESVSREGSPPLLPHVTQHPTPKNHDYSVSLKSESKPSPLEKYRHVALRRTNPRARTPSLTRTSSSGSTSSSQATPRSNRSLSESHEASVAPVIETSAQEHVAEESVIEHDLTNDTRSMDITDIHVSPLRLDADAETPSETRETEESNSQGPQEHEPTFSSEGDPAPYAINSKAATINTTNARSPSPSLAFTPTPAFPRPRARFDLPNPPSDLLATPAPGSRDEDETLRRDVIPATPYNRPSFLLSVINSTARPRLTAGTHHPKMFGTPSMAESTPAANHGSSSNSNPAANLGTAFATVTRRPRIALAPRLSHPLSQAVSAGTSSGSDAVSPIEPWGTYDGTADKASFISTASSHDLTTNPRANTSFDPAMGFGPGAPVGRFNANKLNTYLHGLNRRLQEENETLVERLKELEDEKKLWATSTNEAEISSRRLSNPSRRRSSTGTVLGNVEEDKAEEWFEEKAELEGMVEALKSEVQVYETRIQELQKQLESEQEEREMDKVRWKERMIEIEEGVSELIINLEKRASSAEDETKRMKKEKEKALAEVEGQLDIATERALKAEKLLEGEKDLGSALAEANERIARVSGDLKNASLQIRGLEDEVMLSDSRIEELEKETQNQRDVIADLESAAENRENAISEDRIKTKKLEDTIHYLDEQVRKAKDYAEAVEQGADDANKQIHYLEGEQEHAQETINRLTALEQQNVKDIKALGQQVESARDRERRMEEAVQVAEEKLSKDEEVILELKNRLASLERERQKDTSISSRGSAGMVYTAIEYEALEHELEEANKEKAKLRALLNQTPARKAIEKAKDLKIELLEREKEELLERNRTLRVTVNEIGTPNRLVNTSGISPIHRHVLNMSIRMPKTPGTPLRDLSWLKSMQHDSSMTPLVTEIQRLQGELDRANESIDDKLDKLENAGFDVVSLMQRLEDARTRIITLEDEITDLKRKEDRRARRLARARCQKCHIKLDLENIIHPDDSSINAARDNLPPEPPTPPTRTSENLKANLQAVNDHLDELKQQWETEKSRLLGEKAILQDAANRLNTEIKSTKSEVKKASEGTRMITAAKANVQNELSKAKETIAVLEKELSSERSRLRSMVAEQERMQHEKKRIVADMQRNESDIEVVKQQMEKLKKENQKLEKELRENATIEQKARLLETRVVENGDTIEQLRQERSILANEHKDLQRRFKEINDVADNLRNKCTSLSTSHDNRRHELDMHRLEIEELRKALEDRASDLQRVEREKEKASSEKDNVTRTVAGLEADLRRVKRDAEAFGKDLKALRAEKEKLEARSKDDVGKAERAKKQAQAQIRILTEQLDAERDKASKATESRPPVADDNQLSSLKIQHNKECKGLIVQIRYLKAKFTRESLFREDLTYQKHYLLILLQRFEKSERNIFAAIAQIGFPVVLPAAQKRKPKLKSVVHVLIFLSRVKKSSNAWNQESVSKKLVAAALEDVRKRRLANSD